MMDFSNKLFITFDIEWVVDEVLEYTYKIIERYGIKATFFVTHDTPLLKRLREDDNIELGIHPNFSPLLNNTSTVGFKEIIDDLIKIVPESVSYRSHCLTQSSIISQYATSFLKYGLNTYIPKSAGYDLKPFLTPYQMLSIPHFFEDDFSFDDIGGIDSGEKREAFVSSYLCPSNSLKVFDFHPLHIFLNTDSYQRYLDAKQYYKDFTKLESYVNKSKFGTMDLLVNIIEQGKQKGFEFMNIRDITMED